MAAVIDRQIDSLRTSAAEVSASGMNDGMEAVRREYEDLLALAVALYERVKARTRQWQASVKDWASAEWIDPARDLEARYRTLQETFVRIASALAGVEAAGARPEGADAFRAAKLDLDLLCELSVDEIDRLALDPVGLSVRSHFSYRPDRQTFRVRREDEDGRTFHVYVLFKYAADELTIYVTEIGHSIAPA
jgi:hypothetical protein